MRRVLTAAGIIIVVLALGAGVLYLLGLRVVLDGGGNPHLAFVQSAASNAASVARSREAKRQQPVPVSAPIDAVPPLADGEAATTTETPTSARLSVDAAPEA